jgi:hypothetical protein
LCGRDASQLVFAPWPWDFVHVGLNGSEIPLFDVTVWNSAALLIPGLPRRQPKPRAHMVPAIPPIVIRM